MSYLSTLAQSATLARQTGSDEYAKPTFAAPTTIKTRVVLKGSTKFGSMQGRGNSSELDTIAAVARVPVTTQVGSGDKFVFDGDTYKVLGVRKTPNHRGQTVALNLELTLWPTL